MGLQFRMPAICPARRIFGRFGPLDLRVKCFDGCRNIVPVEGGVCFPQRLRRPGWNRCRFADISSCGPSRLMSTLPTFSSGLRAILPFSQIDPLPAHSFIPTLYAREVALRKTGSSSDKATSTLRSAEAV